MTDKILKSGAFLILSLMSGASWAQVVNGTFSNGPASWNWYHASADASFGGPPYCSTLPYSKFTPSTSSDTPSIGFAPASGRVARLVDYDSYPSSGDGTRLICRQITQAVKITANKKLKFDLKVGDSVSNPSTGVSQSEIAVDVFVIQASKNVILVYTKTGKDVYCPVQSNCPSYLPVEIDMSQFAGQTVTFAIRGSTSLRGSFSGVTSAPSSAYIDNIRVE